MANPVRRPAALPFLIIFGSMLAFDLLPMKLCFLVPLALSLAFDAAGSALGVSMSY